MNPSVRQEFIDLAARGNITWEEYQGIRCNSYEQEVLYPAMTDDCLIRLINTVMIPNSSFCRTSRPAATYDESIVTNFIPILVSRLSLRSPGHLGDSFMCMAEEIAFLILRQLGFGEPKLHPQWKNCVDLAQKKIDENMNLMEQIAGRAARSEFRKSNWHKLRDWLLKRIA